MRHLKISYLLAILMFVFISCAPYNEIKSMKIIDKKVELINSKLSTFDSKFIYSQEDNNIIMYSYKKGNEIKKLHLEFLDEGKTTNIYFNRSLPIFVTENIDDGIYTWFGETKQNGIGIIEYDTSTFYNLYILNWKSFNVKFFDNKGIEVSTYKLSKNYIENILEQVKK